MKLPELDSKYWNERYFTGDFGWDLGQISTPLKHYFDQLTDKKIFILIPGAGNAYEGEYLLSEGFENVYVCDIASEAIINLQKRCPDFNPTHLLQADFFELTDLNFDLIVEQTFFCAINPILRRSYFEQMDRLLKPGGKLVGLLFDDVLNNDKPPFGGNKDEYLGYIPASFKIRVFEPCYNSVKPRMGRELFINLERTFNTELLRK